MMKINDSTSINWMFEKVKSNDKASMVTVTTCTIMKFPEREVVSTGTAKQYVKDAFDKNKARMTSLRKALQNVPKADRAQFYEVYRKSTKNPRW